MNPFLVIPLSPTEQKEFREKYGIITKYSFEMRTGVPLVEPINKEGGVRHVGQSVKL